MFKLNFHYFSFCPLLLVQSLVTTEQGPALSHSPWLGICTTEMNNPRFLSLFSYVRALNHLCWVPSSSSISFFFWGSQSKTRDSRNTSLVPLAALCLMQPRVPLIFSSARAHYWPVVSLCCLCKIAFQVDLSLCWCQRLFLPKHRIQNPLLLNSKRFLSFHFSSFSRSL